MKHRTPLFKKSLFRIWNEIKTLEYLVETVVDNVPLEMPIAKTEKDC